MDCKLEKRFTLALGPPTKTGSQSVEITAEDHEFLKRVKVRWD